MFVECTDVTRILNKTNDLMADKKLFTLQHIISLMVPESHRNTICSYDVALENSVDLHGTIFSEYTTVH